MSIKVFEALCNMVEPPTLESITSHVEKQIRAASLIGILFGKTITISITPVIKNDGLVHSFDCKMDEEDELEKIGDMTIEDVIVKISPQIAENIRKDVGPDISDFLNGILGSIGKEIEDDESENDNSDSEGETADDKPHEQVAP